MIVARADKCFPAFEYVGRRARRDTGKLSSFGLEARLTPHNVLDAIPEHSGRLVP